MNGSAIRVRLSPGEPLSSADFFALRPPFRGAGDARRLALGTAALGQRWEASRPDACVRVLHEAWSGGFLLVDTAPNYWKAEELVGAALRGWQGAAPILCTKLEGHGDGRTPAPGENRKDLLTSQFERSRTLFAPHPVTGLAIHGPDEHLPEFESACVAFLQERMNDRDIAATGIGGGGPEMQARWLPREMVRYAITYFRINAVSLQGLTDLAPLAAKHRVSVVAAGPMVHGLLGDRFDAYTRDGKRPGFLPKVFAERALLLADLAQERRLPLSQLALRFVLSIPQVAAVLAGPNDYATWRDCRTAYEAGPLDTELYRRVWAIATAGAETLAGG